MTSALFVLCFVSFNCFVYNDAVVLPNTTRQTRRYVKDFVFPDSLQARIAKPDVDVAVAVAHPIEQQTRVAVDNNNNRTSSVPATTSQVNSPKTCADYDRVQSIQNARLLLTRLNATSTSTVDNAVDYIRSIIANELDLFDVEYKILQAKLLSNNEILFEMATPQEAFEVLTQYCKLLKDTMWSEYLKAFKISETERNFFD